MSGCCRSVENWSGASQTSRFLLGPDGRLWKPRADHSQSPCRLETAACRLRRKETGRRRPTTCKRKEWDGEDTERKAENKNKGFPSMQFTLWLQLAYSWLHKLQDYINRINQTLQKCPLSQLLVFIITFPFVKLKITFTAIKILILMRRTMGELLQRDNYTGPL